MTRLWSLSHFHSPVCDASLRWRQAARAEWKRSSAGRKDGHTYYVCNKHTNCGAKMKAEANEKGDIALYYKGKHTTGGNRIKQRGANPVVKRIAADKVFSQKQPRTIAFEANEETKGQNVTPITCTQVRNLRRTMIKQLVKDVNLVTVADLRVWATALQVAGKGPEWDALAPDQMFVPPGGVFDNPEFPVVVFTTKELLANAPAATTDCAPVCILLDATFKLIAKNWVVEAVGVEGIRFDRGANRHQFRPICVAVAVSECAETYEVLLRSVAQGAQLLFDIHFDPTWALSDHCDAAQNAAAIVFPGIKSLTCWPHLSRNAKKKGVVHIVAALHRCTTVEQFNALQQRFVQGMKTQRGPGATAAECEGGVADTAAGGSAANALATQQPPQQRPGAASQSEWRKTYSDEQITLVEKTYGSDRWKGWFRGASGVAGVTPNINSQERWHRMWKEEYRHLGLRMALPLFLQSKLPFVLKAFTADRGSSVRHARGPGVETAQMVRRARRVQTLPDFWELCGPQLYIDATPHQMQPMTTTRLTQFTRGLKGQVDDNVHWTELAAHHLYVVRVTFSAYRPPEVVCASADPPAIATPPMVSSRPHGCEGNLESLELSPEPPTAEGPAAATATAEDPAVATATAEGPAAVTATAEGPAAATATKEGPAAATAITESPAAAIATTEGSAAAIATTESPATATATMESPAAATATMESPAAVAWSAKSRLKAVHCVS
eukprot:GHVU01066388.1.p1 GENE.GHVU01066388.1~~GHVU01066388.1.p1  ORF type:complete len:725 (-),score=115.75 GHVU01066388.1:559-2733(-)